MSNVVVNPYRFAAAGAASWSTASDNCILGGGSYSPWTSTASAMKYTGTWSNITALPAFRQLLAGGGNFDDGIMFGGDNSGTVNLHDDTYGWNGSVWSSLALISIDNMMLIGGGNTTDAIWAGGTYAYVNTCQTFDSSTWSTVNSLVHGTRAGAGSGKSSDAFCMGGYTDEYPDWNQQFDGTDWALSTTLPTGIFYGTSTGAGLSGVQIVSLKESSAGVCSTFDGTSFASTASTNYLRNTSMMGGDATNCMKAGGYDAGFGSDDTETYDGNTWTTQGLMTEDLFVSGFGGNIV